MVQAINKTILRSLLGLASVVEVRDPYTGGHLWRVGQFSKLLALKLGMDQDAVFGAAIGGYLHDLGKIGVPDAILRKPDRLTEDEFAVIKTHPVTGMELLNEHPLAFLAVDAVWRHHERCDGSGYPDGLEREQVPEVARIVGIADAFDAMTSTRSYRAGMPIDKALGILLEERGRQFDPTMVDAFAALHRVEGKLEHVVGHSDHGQKLAMCPACGPVIVVPRAAGNGSSVYCRTCGGLFQVERRGDDWETQLVGKAPDSGVLRPRAEFETIDEFVEAVPPVRSSYFLGRISDMIGLGGGAP